MADNKPFDRKPARLQDASFHIVGALTQVRMAGIQLAPRVQDRNHRLVFVIFVPESHLLQPGTMAERSNIIWPEPTPAAQVLWFLTSSVHCNVLARSSINQPTIAILATAKDRIGKLQSTPSSRRLALLLSHRR